MPRPRDSQRSKLYSAENTAFKRSGEPEFKTVEECQAYIDKVLSSVWFKKHWRLRQAKVRPGKGYRKAVWYGYGYDRNKRGDEGGIVQLPKWARKRWVILHELSHGLTPNEEASHGWKFARNYLKLVKHFLGQEEEKKLKEAFKNKRVKYSQPRQLSEERKKALQEHMLRVRAKLNNNKGEANE